MSGQQDISDLAQFRSVFFDECAERLDEIQHGLGQLDGGVETDEAVHGLFRAVHSIKAGAGAFGFDRLVAFAHLLESVLDLIREKTVPLSQDLTGELVRSADILGDLVTAAQSGTPPPEGLEHSITHVLLSYLSSDQAAPETAGPSKRSDADGRTEGSAVYEIQFSPPSDLFRNAHEPLHFVRDLARLGSLETCVQTDDVPGLDAFDPEICYLKWAFRLETAEGPAEIREVFEFVDDGTCLTIRNGDGDGSPHGPAEAHMPQSAGAARPEDTSAADRGEGRKHEEGTDEEGTRPAPAGPAPAAPAAAVPTRTIRVDLDRVDRLVNMVGELVIAQSMVLQRLGGRREAGFNDHLTGMDDLTQRTRELQEGVMAIRMQPVRSVFMRLPRILREAAEKLGKQAQLVMTGEQTEVDKTIIEELSEPLTHMLRNAVDHGLEPPEERTACGKPEAGTVHLSAEHRGGRIVIAMRDDGRGLNLDKIRKRAIDRGLIASHAELSAHDLKQMIFAPGFSTADSVSDLSGRGVGMDVVRRKVQSLGGRLTVESEPGAGTTISLSLPLTLAVLDGMMVVVGAETFIIPLTAIIETLRPAADQLRWLGESGQLLSIRGAFVPVVPLGKVFDTASYIERPEEALIVLVETGTGQRLGLVVDDLIGQQQVVIKSLEENYQAVAGVAGATILGDGQVALILDIEGLPLGAAGPAPEDAAFPPSLSPEMNSERAIAERYHP